MSCPRPHPYPPCPCCPHLVSSPPLCHPPSPPSSPTPSCPNPPPVLFLLLVCCVLLFFLSMTVSWTVCCVLRYPVLWWSVNKAQKTRESHSIWKLSVSLAALFVFSRHKLFCHLSNILPFSPSPLTVCCPSTWKI